MPLNKDFEELFHLLNSARAKYLVVGAYAVIFHTEPRYTKDIDIWIKPERKNAKKIFTALKRFGAPLGDLTVEDLMDPRMVYQIGVEPNRIDILMGVGSLLFDEAWKRKRIDRYGRKKIYLLDLDDLVRAKKDAGRARDLLDLEVLEEAARKRKKR